MLSDQNNLDRIFRTARDVLTNSDTVLLLAVLLAGEENQMASKVITIRIDSEEHERWKSHAREQGKAFNAWAREALEDQYKLETALGDESESKRSERLLVKRAVYPQGKKSFEPDWRT